MAQMAQAFGLGGGMPQPSPEEIAELQKKFGGGAGMGAGIPTPPPGAFSSKPGLPGLPGLGGKPGGLPGLGGLPGFNPFGKKK
jgi:signal recognition particle subunit SRP54